MTVWKDLPDTSTPITAAELNRIEAALVTLTARTAKLPWAEAQGSQTFSLAAVNNLTIAVAFPPGRFTVAPRVYLNIAGAPGGSQKLIAKAYSITTDGCSIIVQTTDAAPITVSVPVSWHAVQMTETQADG